MEETTHSKEPVWDRIEETGMAAGHRVAVYDSLDSTNALALDMGLDEQLPENGTVICAKAQTKGRGRLGRSWISAPGTGLYFSVMLRPDLSREDLAKITLAAGLAVARAVEGVCGLPTMIKWPNDVLVRGRKVAGILTESGNWAAGAGPFVVVGVGINVNTPEDVFPEDLRGRAGSLAVAAGRRFDRGEVLEAVLRRLDYEISRLEGDDFPGLLAEWRAKDATLNRRLTWLTPEGGTVTGISLGPDQEGLLRVKDDEGNVHAVLSGDLDLLA